MAAVFYLIPVYLLLLTFLAVVLVPLLYLGFTKSIPFKPQYEIKAAFESSNNLKSGSPVRIAGVEVGKVTGVEPASEGSDAVLVTMTVGKAGRPIHEDARAIRDHVPEHEDIEPITACVGVAMFGADPRQGSASVASPSWIRQARSAAAASASGSLSVAST